MNNDQILAEQTEYLFLIRYPRFRQALEAIKRGHELSNRTRVPHCMTLVGPAGVGKTTLVKDYARSFPEHRTEEGVTVPILYLETPVPVTVSSLVGTMLNKLGTPPSRRKTAASIFTAQLINLIRERRVELIILDDFRNPFDDQKGPRAAAVSGWLTKLIQETQVPILFVSGKYQVLRTLTEHPQLAPLFRTSIDLQPFLWDPSNSEITREFTTFVQTVEEKMKIHLPWRSKSDRDLLCRLHYASDGVVHNLMRLMLVATKIANDQGVDKLDMAILSVAFDQYISHWLRTKINPFLDFGETDFVPPEEPKGDGEGGAGVKNQEE